MSDRKKPNWLLWTAAGLLLPVLYVASFGPVCWMLGLSTQGEPPAAPMIYAPIGTIIHYSPDPISYGVWWYGSVGLHHDVDFPIVNPDGQITHGMLVPRF